MIAFGSEYNANWGRVYGRYELVSNLANANRLNSDAQNKRSAFGFEAKYADNGSLYSEYRLTNSDTSTDSNSNSNSNSNAQLAYGLKHKVNFLNDWSLTGNYEKVQPTHVSDTTSTATSAVQSSSERNTAAGLTLEYKGFENARLSSRIEGRISDQEKSNNFLLAAAYKLNTEWSSLARVAQENRYVLGQTGNNTENTRVQLGLAYRPNRSDQFNVLAKYENRYEITTPVGGVDDYTSNLNRTHILSIHANIRPDVKLQLDARLAAKWLTSNLEALETANSAQLIYTRATYDLTDRFDIAAQVFWMHSHNGALQKGVGLELGYLISSDVWLSLGYNVFGFKEFDLAGQAQLTKGAYLRLRMKFDESGLKW